MCVLPFHAPLLFSSPKLVKQQKHIKDLVTISARHVMDQGGVVRNIQFLGTQTLPQVMRRRRQNYTVGE
jgi:small subunit ribosomal protein S6